MYAKALTRYVLLQINYLEMEAAEELNPISQRLKEIIDHFEKGVQRQFALKIEVPAGRISELFGERKSKPSGELLAKVAAAYPQVHTDWLLLGEGKMLKTSLPNSEPLKNLSYIRPPAGAPEPGLAADLVSQLSTEEKPGPGDINIGVVPRKKAQPVGTDLVKQVARNTADIQHIFELLRGGGTSVGPDSPLGSASGPSDTQN